VNRNEGLNSVPVELRDDSWWKREAYRLALFAAHLGWRDVTKLRFMFYVSRAPN
jgi:hypothetical protein